MHRKRRGILQERNTAPFLTCPDEHVCRFVSVRYKSLEDLPEGAVVGSAALRRQAQLLNRYPTLKIVNFRGNVQSRIRKLQEGKVAQLP
jgi:porphobilinogen deaminase